ncbi:MAG: enoyl-CoA hydratase/isomerase family protein [Acidobacteria bacterium]|nr:enoyl-CoA hydratase/isomerase family protein [Acidobacteriota bacterium]
MILADRTDNILLLTLNRPEKRNSLHPEMISALSEALEVAGADEKVSVAVITGTGPVFCAGLDLNHLLSLDIDDKVKYLKQVFSLFRRIYELPQPVIAAINGPAMAGGFDLSAFCDLRYCVPEAKFAQTEVLLGLTQIMFPLYKVIGLGRAKELALTGEAIPAEEAFRIGLVNRIFSSDDLLPEVMKIAGTLASRPPQALFETKRLSRELIDMDTDSALRLMLTTIIERLGSDEHRAEAERFVAKLKSR